MAPTWAGHPPLRVWINFLNPPAPTRRLDRWAITGSRTRMCVLSGGPRRYGWRRANGHCVRPILVPSATLAVAEGMGADPAGRRIGRGRSPRSRWRRAREATAQRNRGKTLQFHWLKTVDPVSAQVEEHVIGECRQRRMNLGSQATYSHRFVEGGLRSWRSRAVAGLLFHGPDDRQPLAKDAHLRRGFR